MPPASEKSPGKHALTFIAITMAIDMAGVGIIIPVMPDLIQSLSPVSTGEAARIGGWLVFAYAIMQFFCAPIAGNLSDRFGRRPILLIALGGLAIDYLFMAVAPALWMLFVGRTLAGVAGATWSVANAYVADVSDGASRAKNFGIVSAAGAAGLILAPALGGVLAGIDTRAPFYVAAALTALNMIYGWIVLPETLRPENRRPFEWRRANPLGGLGEIKHYPSVLGILSALFLMQIATQSLVHIWAFFNKEQFGWNPFDVGVSVTFYAITLAAIQGGLTGEAVKRFGEVTTALIGLMAGLISFLIFAFANAGWQMYVGVFIGCIGGLTTPSMQALMTKVVPENAQGALQGAITCSLAITIVIGPILMTQLFAAFTDDKGAYFPGAPFLMAGVLILASASLFKIVTASMPSDAHISEGNIKDAA